VKQSKSTIKIEKWSWSDLLCDDFKRCSLPVYFRFEWPTSANQFKFFRSGYAENRATRYVCEKIAQNTAQPTFCQHYLIDTYCGKSHPKIWAALVIFKITALKQTFAPLVKINPIWSPCRAAEHFKYLILKQTVCAKVCKRTDKRNYYKNFFFR
jgi:hypothetical protein